MSLTQQNVTCGCKDDEMVAEFGWIISSIAYLLSAGSK
jgi:hypothetical protein